MNGYDIADQVLAHHGILGQKWGVRNGPPYPLKAGDHSASEKKAGWRKSLAGDSGSSSVDMTLDAANLVVTAKTQSIVNKAMKELRKKDIDYQSLDKLEKDMGRLYKSSQVMAQIFNPVYGLLTVPSNVKGRHREKASLDARKNLQLDDKTGLYLKSNQNASMRDDAKSVNPKWTLFTTDLSVQRNCVLCSTAYDMRRRGYEVIAKKTYFGRHFENTVEKWYPGAERVRVKNLPQKRGLFGVKAKKSEIESRITKAMSALPDNSRGIIHIDQGRYGINHAMNFERKDGVTSFIDAQSGHVYDTKKIASVMKSGGGEMAYYRTDHLKPDIDAIKKGAVQ